METLVSTEWLSQHLSDDDLVVLDCSVHTDIAADGAARNRSARAEFDAGHIPGAGFADLTGDLCDPASDLEFTVPAPEQFCDAMGRLGVGDGSRVVLYDSFLSAWAARVWWMLRWVGFDQAALLDGGLRAWTEEGRPVSTDPPQRTPQMLTPRPRPELIADRDEVQAAIGGDRVRLIDTMPSQSYRGEMQLYGRPGHIPGAVNIPAMDVIDETGRFRPRRELEAMHGGDRAARTITYCGGGILASASAFVLTRLGYRDVAVYTGSLQEWAADPANPMVAGAE